MILKRHSPFAKLWLFPLVLLLILANGGFAQAAPLDPAGDIDTTFDTDGISLANFATVYSFAAARAAARQSTGRIVLAGESVDNGQHHFALLRLTTSGLQDPTWGNGGEAKLAIGSSDLINDIAVQADDKVVAVGFSSLTVNVFTIMRYHADGALDMAFGGNNTGYITVDFQGVNSPLQRANAVAIQDDGKIVVAGYRRDNDAGGDDVALVRLNTNGTLDTTFDSDGKVTTGYQPSTGSDQALDVQIVGTGASRKILVGGRTKPTGDNPQNMLLIRYNNNGTLDTSFDGDGVKVHDVPGNTCWPQGFACGGESIRAMALQPDGKIVATGGWESYQQFPSTSGATDTDMITVRFNADGSLDTGFGGANATDSPNGGPGYVITSVARGYYTDIGLSIAVEPDGQIVSLGYTDQSEDFPAYVPPNYNFYYNQNFLIQRLNADGSRDSGFGPSPSGTKFQPGTVVPAGVVVIDLSEEGKTYDIGHAVVLQPDGKIVGAGRRTFQDAATSDTYFGAVRLNTNGTVDYTYGPDKNTTSSLNGTPDGTPDGYFYAQMLGGSIDVTNGVAQQPNGKLVLAGYTNIGGSQSRFGLARLNTDGTLDGTFSGDGLVTAGALGMVTHSGNAVALDSTTQKIVVTGESSSGVGAPSLTTMRFNTDGSLDTSFSNDGIATNVWGSNANTAYAVAVQPNGKILVGGSVSDSSGNWDWLLVRYNSDGSLDTSFDDDGMLRRDIGTNQNFDYIQSIVIQPDGNILVGGYSSSSSGALQGSVFALARFSSTGVVDSSFTTPAANAAGDEEASTPIPGGGVFTRLSAANQAYAGDQIRGLALMADGRIVAAGKALNSSGYNTFALARYMPDGRLDTGFGDDGLQTHNVAADTMDEIMGIVLQHDDKIAAFGNTLFLNGGGADVKLARFNWDDGSLDSTYATNGYVLTNISGYDRPVGGAIIPSGIAGAGKTIAGANPGSADFASLRYLGDPPPTQPGMLDLTDASDSGRSTSDNITNDNTPTFLGACETGETVILKVDNAVTSPLSRAICHSGTYNVIAAVTIADGTHTFSVFSRNSYGDSGSTGTISVVIDTVALPPNITVPAAGSTLLPNPSISGNGVETTADVAVTRASNAVCSDQADTSGVWSCNSVLGPGSYTISVRQTDIAGNTSNAATRSFSIKAPTTTVLASSGDPTVYGQPVTFTASVASGYGTPDGTVQFVVDSSSPISVTLSAAGTASLTRSNLSVGAHSVVANYQGATLYFPSSGVPLTQTVNKADSIVTITSSANPSLGGQSVTLTAQVTAVAPGAGLPSGAVTFKDGAVTLGSGILDASGQASFSTSSLTVGAHSVSVVYIGDASFGATTAMLTQTVARANSSTSLNASLTSLSFGQPVSFTATVTTSLGLSMPTGTVIFKDAGTAFATATLDGAGHAIVTTAGLASGAHTITVEYSGDTNFNASQSSSSNLTVAKTTTTTSITSSANPSLYGQLVSFSATVTRSIGVGIPAGNVTFKEGSTILGVVALDSTGVASFISSNLEVGSRVITAEYSGGANWEASTSLTLMQEVRPSADLMVSNRPSTSQMNGGGTLAYTVIVSNSGPLEAHNVMLSVSLPAGGSLDTQPVGCSATSTTVECSLGTVAKGAVISKSLSLTISSDLADGSVLISRATVTSDTPDGNMANNDSQASTLVGSFRVYMPLFMYVQPAPVQAPDLVVTRIAAGPRSIEIVIKNQGSVAVTNGFWVDLYVAPNPVPERPNQLWSDGRSKQGAVWGIHGVTLAPGAELRLTLNDAYYASQYSQIKQLAVGTPMYVQVDSANAVTSYGAIQEADEIGAGPYNNISSTTVVATAGLEPALATVPVADFDDVALPARAQVPTPRKPEAITR